MCRMLFISLRKEIPNKTLLYYLIDAEKSIIKQSKFNEKRLQKDGWGIAYYLDDKLSVFKSPKPIYEEEEVLKEKIEHIKTKNFLIHVRRASNPRKIDTKKLISHENTQPFYLENILFSHNGTLNIVDEVYENLGKYKKYVKGLNDSEVLFWHFIKNLNAYGNIEEAIKAQRREIYTVWISVKKDYSKFKEPYTGLNIFVCDGSKFYALCDFKLKKETFSLMTPNWEYGSYAFKKDNNTFIISSEPLDNTKWEKISYNSIVFFDRRSFKIELKDAGELL